MALIVPSFLVVQDATKGGAPDCDCQKEHADGNRKEWKGLHECLQNSGEEHVWEMGGVQVCYYAKSLFFISRKHRLQLSTLAYKPSRRTYSGLHSVLRP